MQPIKILFLAIAMLVSMQASAQQTKDNILFCYGDLFPEKVKGYDFLILESIHFSAKNIQTFKKHNQNVLAYISLGEVNAGAPHYRELKEVTLSKNEIWNSYVLNLGDTTTQKVLEQIIDNHLKKGFNGIFLDNIDNYTKWGPTPEKLPELLRFLRAIKTKYPTAHLMQNAGLEILPQTASLVNSVAVESVATDYNFKNKSYQLRAKKEFTARLEQIQTLSKEHNRPIILIEYAKTKKMIKAVKKRIAGAGLPYFIGHIELQTIPTDVE